MGTTNAQTNTEKGSDETSIDAFFAESVILITGATGFVGKALVEKLLRVCPRLAIIFILIRPKRNQTVEQRFKSFLESFAFDEIRPSKLLSKLKPVKGDVALPDLGLSQEDKNMLTERVNIIFHSAATVRFNEPIKVAVNLNTNGTDRMIELSKSMKNLISFIHVSTAYSNSNRDDIEEVIYPTNVKPSTIIDMCENLDKDTLNILEKKILEIHPNTYTFTKKLAEQIILEKGKDLPIAIVRPSIIGAAEKEPFPGWVDNIFGVTATLIEVGNGNVKSIVTNAKLKCDIIPVDRVIDTLICAAWYTSVQKRDTIKVYNCTNSASPLSWGNLIGLIKKHAIETPSQYVTWYPCCTYRQNRFIHNLILFTLNIFPAFLIDIFVKLTGGKPIMMKLMNRVQRFAEASEYFTMHEWHFHRDNLYELAKKVKSLKDSNNFVVISEDLNWESYLRSYILGIRTFIQKDTPETLKTARNRLHVLYWLRRFTQVFSIFTVLMIVLRIAH
ncbi:putative fatty acyl-CoA reductase CG5065 [Osmia bicornis bicornis]|uniref:putative fatty acyl-CoA reductase CG5065 n=1 Tax=Osmia bicornis bicornis TaxID=1437191 RepID=UPI001EAEF051|nr:putative fatty acyl-CoA reductase CG5065 [Osmia bicornis bicornis]XP_046146109.1 putative fatty acyl-CoA reductase CG5065 [Osmia bicornis bicornis]XP_046146110.1 putative fatty acyl-CoA reductase CG5065 [Osmia bicornis bicornis]XP_046146111.1 putative fatty acyl-CoA reductase CG5065 [Osmia bicornis bicornis]XP_046146112.1 putative fatty acyl-CoA reductase CG5065 [Osmia bicornis bicornis]